MTGLSSTQRIESLCRYALLTREGVFGMGKRVKVKSVQTALAAVAHGVESRGGLAEVRKTRATDEKISVRLSDMFKAMEEEDDPIMHHPPATAELLLTISRENEASRRGEARIPGQDLCERRDDLIELAFLACLRGGEYARSPKRKEWLEEGVAETIAFEDVTLFADQRVVCENGVWAEGFDLGDEASIVIRVRNARVNFKNQKNGMRNHKMYLVAALDEKGRRLEICPVAALVRILLSGRRMGTSVSAPIHRVGGGKESKDVTLGEVQKRLQRTLAENPHLADSGSSSDEKITPHSLRSGGAMFYHCAGVDKAYIRILGRWKSDAIFSYLTERFPDAGGWAIRQAMANVGGEFSRGESRTRGFMVVRLAQTIAGA
jgi:hypothetical protein